MTSAGSKPSPCVVLVDDDAALANAIQFAFELDGLDVRTYPDGETLLRSGDLPEAGCFVLDLHLPGIDGLDLLKVLRARGTRLPAVLITSNPSRELKARARCAGVSLVEKPLLGDALLETVQGFAAAAG